MLTQEIERISEKKVSKRQLLIGAVKAGFLGLVGLAVGREVQTTVRGYVQTEVGRFFPVYERHDKHAEVQDSIVFPQPCHGFFPETVSAKNMDSSPVNVALQLARGHDTEIPTIQLVLTDKTLAKIIDEQIPLVYGDVESPSMQATTWEQTAIALRDACAGYGKLFLAAQVGADVRNAITGREAWHAPVSRRFILKSGVAATVGALMAANEQKYMQEKLMEGLDSHSELVRRAYARVSGIVSQLRPEYTNEFFRNLVVANKLLLYGEHIETTGFSNPNIVFQYHGGHSGIEDFLVLGRQFCRTLLAQFPSEFLNECYRLNGGIEKFCSVRVIQLAHNFTYRRTLVEKSDGPLLVCVYNGDISQDEQLVDTSLHNYLLEREAIAA